MQTHLLLAAVMASGLSTSAQSTPDSAAIQDCAKNYIEGWLAADGEQIAKAIHPMLSKCRVLPNNTFQSVSYSRLVQKTKEGIGQTPEAQRVMDISVLDQSDDRASVMVVSNEFFDLLNLAKIGDAWKVVNVVWDYHAATDQGSREEVEKAASDYIHSIHAGDGAMLATLLHAQVAIRRPVSLEQVEDVSGEWLIQQVTNGRWSGIPKESRQIAVNVMKMHKGCASVKVTSQGATEYLQMCRRGDKWQIVKILWDRASVDHGA